MLLGKRPRPPIKRTTSMTGITVMDASDVEAAQPAGQSFLSPRGYHSHDFADQTPSFLSSCGLCRRRLAPGRDIYMYRGDTAFCSLECREEQMKQDERKEKLSQLMSSQQQADHENNNNNTRPSPNKNNNASTKSRTIVSV